MISSSFRCNDSARNFLHAFRSHFVAMSLARKFLGSFSVHFVAMILPGVYCVHFLSIYFRRFCLRVLFEFISSSFRCNNSARNVLRAFRVHFRRNGSAWFFRSFRLQFVARIPPKFLACISCSCRCTESAWNFARVRRPFFPRQPVSLFAATTVMDSANDENRSDVDLERHIDEDWTGSKSSSQTTTVSNKAKRFARIPLQ